MHPSAHIVLSGIEACRRYLRQHPGQPVRALNRRFDYAETAEIPAATAPGQPTDRRWVELCPHSAGITVQLADGAHRTLVGSLFYPAAPARGEQAGDGGGAAEGDNDGLWAGIDPAAITAPPFLTQLAAAADRALEQLDSFSFPEALHG